MSKTSKIYLDMDSYPVKSHWCELKKEKCYIPNVYFHAIYCMESDHLKNHEKLHPRKAKYPEIQVRWWLAGVAIRAQIRGLEASHSPSRPVRDRWAGRLQGTLQLCNRHEIKIYHWLHN